MCGCFWDEGGTDLVGRVHRESGGGELRVEGVVRRGVVVHVGDHGDRGGSCEGGVRLAEGLDRGLEEVHGLRAEGQRALLRLDALLA